MRHRRIGLSAGLLAATLVAAVASIDVAAEPQARARVARTYTLYVCAESEDVVEKIRFGPGGFEHLKSIGVGAFPTEIEGPHGINLAPEGEHWYLSIAHGLPFGQLHKFDADTDEWITDVRLGMFPATLAVSPSTGLALVVNFNLHGEPQPSTISVVETDSMTEVGEIPVGVMPHGLRMDAAGRKAYSVNMMDDTLVEIDVYRMEIARVLPLSENAVLYAHMPGGPHNVPTAASPAHGSAPDDATEGDSDRTVAAATGDPAAGKGGTDGSGAQAAGAAQSEAAMPPTPMPHPIIKPTWATSPTPQGKIYVAANGHAEVLEVDLEAWEIRRRFPTPAGPYNIAVTPDGSRMAVTYKSSESVGIWDLESGEELAGIDTLRPIPHGIVISDDGRYAFASIEGIGGEPGSVEAYDLGTLERVGNIDLAKQAGGIAILESD